MQKFPSRQRQGFRFFSRFVGQSDPWSKKWWVIFWNDGLTTDYTVEPVLSGNSKKKTNFRLMQVKSTCKGSILQSFRPSLSYHFLLRSLFWLFSRGCLRHCLLYWQPTMYFLFCGIRRLTVRWIFFLLKWDFFTTKKDGSTGPTALVSDGPYFEIIGQWPGPTMNLKACKGFVNFIYFSASGCRFRSWISTSGAPASWQCHNSMWDDDQLKRSVRQCCWPCTVWMDFPAFQLYQAGHNPQERRQLQFVDWISGGSEVLQTSLDVNTDCFCWCEGCRDIYMYNPIRSISCARCLCFR